MEDMIRTIKTGGYELIESRTFHVLENEETVLSFDTSSIIFTFEKTESGEPSIRVDGSKQKEVKFILTNVNLPSYGTTDFVKFAEGTDHKDVYISFRVHSLNDKKVRSLEYSIYKK